MENFEALKNTLNKFNPTKVEIKDRSSSEGRKNYAEAIAKCFEPCAKEILAGYFEVTDLEKNKRYIQPTAIELYYHEEGPNGFKDPIMYHTNDRMNTNDLPYFPVGSLNPHVSGIDVTFENSIKQYRASFLIRKYDLSFKLNSKPTPKKNSTEIYDDMLVRGIPMDDTEWIKWVPDNEKKIEVVRGWRQNVPKYEEDKENPGQWKKVKATIEDKETFSSNKTKYVRCPFKWQFKIIK